MTVVFPTGALVDPPAKAGRASLCVRAMNEGPARLSKVEWESALADLAVSVDVSAGTELSSVSLRALKEVWKDALDLAVEVTTTPGLRQADLDRVRARALAQLAQQKGSAGGIASRLQARVAWGEQHPLGALPTEATLNAITVDDCRAFAQSLRPDGARVFVAGDVSMTDVVAALTTQLAKHAWQGAVKPAPKVPAARKDTAFDRAAVVLVDVPGAEQSVITVVAEGPARQAKDYDATAVMASILGGGFSSRINMNLREKNGFTYGARAGFSYWKDRGLFTMSSSIRTDATAKALREVSNEFKAIVTTAPITDAELARERDGSLLAFPSSFATSSSTLDTWSNVFFYGLPLKALPETPARLARLTQKDIAAAAKAHLPKKARVFVVGDLAKVKADVKALAAEGVFGVKGDVVVVDADGVLQK